MFPAKQIAESWPDYVLFIKFESILKKDIGNTSVEPSTVIAVQPPYYVNKNVISYQIDVIFITVEPPPYRSVIQFPIIVTFVELPTTLIADPSKVSKQQRFKS